MTKKEEKILGYIKYLCNTDYINDADEMQQHLEEIYELISEKLPKVEELDSQEDIDEN